MNNEERRIRQGGTLEKRGLLLFWGNIFIGDKEKRKRGSFGIGSVFLDY
jgi:hypothetical protein